MTRALSLLALIFLLQACGNTETRPAPSPTASENDMDAARNFIRAALDGKWDDTRKYLLRDSLNDQLIDMAENRYGSMNRDDQRSYRESSIQVYSSRQLGDSATIVIYSNSFRNKKDSLKVVRNNSQWLIDLKYSLLPNDTTKHVH